MALIEEHPYIDESGVAHENLVRHFSDVDGRQIRQIETNTVYDEAVDIYPCRYTYEEVVEEAEESNNGEEDTRV